jgi:hypothetical protein
VLLRLLDYKIEIPSIRKVWCWSSEQFF